MCKEINQDSDGECEWCNKTVYPRCWGRLSSLNYLWGKCKWIARFNLLPGVENCFLKFRFVETFTACTGAHTVYASSETFTISVTQFNIKSKISTPSQIPNKTIIDPATALMVFH
jgi:hypothetical protein